MIASRAGLVARASAQPAATILLVGVTAAVRLAYIAWAGIVQGGDTPLYLSIADSFADGEPTTGGFPTHVLYGVTLAPAYLIGLDVKTWVIALHLVFAIATVLLVYRTALFFAGPVGSLLAGLAAGLLPTAMFWSHYILTETLFLLVLAGFLYACARAVMSPGLRFALSAPLVSAALLLVTRPTGVPVALVGLGFVLWASVAERAGARQARRAVAVAAIGVLGVSVTVLAVPLTRDALMTNRTFVASLWNSTRIWTSDFDHVNRGVRLPEDLAALSPSARLDEQRARAWRFIREHPAEYARRAAVRFGSFWFPWVTASWGRAHKLYDAFLSLALVMLAIYALARPPLGRGKHILALIVLVALAQAVLVAFSQIDSEARYRLPAELTLLPLLALPIDRLISRKRTGGSTAA